jgi:hypothetical protein
MVYLTYTSYLRWNHPSDSLLIYLLLRQQVASSLKVRQTGALNNWRTCALLAPIRPSRRNWKGLCDPPPLHHVNVIILYAAFRNDRQVHFTICVFASKRGSRKRFMLHFDVQRVPLQAQQVRHLLSETNLLPITARKDFNKKTRGKRLKTPIIEIERKLVRAFIHFHNSGGALA